MFKVNLMRNLLTTQPLKNQPELYISFFQYSWHGIRDLQGRPKYKPYRRRALTTHYALLKSA